MREWLGAKIHISWHIAHEFIEVYNPTSTAIKLAGCSLRLGSSGRTFALPDEYLATGGFRAFYDGETGISLPNSTAQAVWLLAGSHEISVLYADDMEEALSWAWIEGQWQQTAVPTPGEANRPTPPKGMSPSPLSAVTGSTPCPVGKERNAATNRCRTVVLERLAPQPVQRAKNVILIQIVVAKLLALLSGLPQFKMCPQSQGQIRIVGGLRRL